MTTHGIRIGLDLGSSSTKLAALDLNGSLVATMRLGPREGERLPSDQAVQSFLEENGIAKNRVAGIVVTGVGALSAAASVTEKAILPDLPGLPARHVDEFTCTARGALAQTGRREAIVVSMGTGSAIVYAHPDGQAVHVGGTGVGGGMLMGLCRHFYNITDFSVIADLAARGDIRKVDLKIADLAGGHYTHLAPDLTLANLAKIDPDAIHADLISGFVNVTLETICTAAFLASRIHNVNTIILTGGLAVLPQAEAILAPFMNLTGREFLIARPPLFITAIGAARQ